VSATRSPASAAAPPPPPASPGTRIAPGYEVLEHLARGKSLDVYDVWSEERDCHCAAKALRPDRLAHAGSRRRLVREATILLGMTHPHVVRAYELVRAPDPVLVLELLTGGSVQQTIEAGRPRAPVDTIVELGIQLCSAVHYIHGRGVLHGDLKPGNVMTDCGFAKVVDFSLARRPGRGVRGRGTRAYMAPEQARGGAVSCKTDVWGIGTVLYATAVGAAPFRSRDGDYPQLEVRAERLERNRRLPSSHAALGDLVAACLEPDPRRRPTVVELTAGLDALLPD